jgi:hypothetical protein
MKQQKKRWVIDVAGAPGTLYTGETYKLQVDFPEHYPMEAPQVKYLQSRLIIMCASGFSAFFFNVVFLCCRLYFCIQHRCIHTFTATDTYV